MKKSTLLIAALLIASVAFAGNSDLKGPKAKNAKPWNPENAGQIALSISEKQDVKGPKAKNRKVWIAGSKERQPILSEPNKLKGPKAKNAKPWAKY